MRGYDKGFYGNEIMIIKFDYNFITNSWVYFDTNDVYILNYKSKIISNSSQDTIYQDESITPTVIIRNFSNILNSKTLISNYSFTDITECIWPRFLGNYSDWVAQLPEFLMENTYDFKIGSNINDVHTLPAFSHHLNAKFVRDYFDNWFYRLISNIF